MDSEGGQAAWGWAVGEGDARGIALVFLFAGLVMVTLALWAFTTRSYRLLSAEYAGNAESVVAEEPTDVDRVASEPRR